MAKDELLKPLPPSDYSKQFNVNAPAHREKGFNILHNKSANIPYTENPSAVEFVKNFMVGATPLEADAEVLAHACAAAKNNNGEFLEMGVGMGRTINLIASLNPKKTIYGFDSFEGLPENWDKGDKVIPKGVFAVKDSNYAPSVYRNVELYKGLFKDVLPKFKAQILRDQVIAFLHIDCDSYTPTSEVFNILESNIKPGTVILFDELYNYPNYEQHEWKAFQEFLAKTGYQFEPLAYNINHEQVAVRIK
jgi:hypothetical protein